MIALIAVALLTSLGADAPVADSLADRIESVLRTPEYRHGRWGLLIVDSADGKVLYEKAADQLFRPASVTKLFSTAAALIEFGPDHRFRTPVVRRGQVGEDGVLRGDLILVAQGDLALGGRTGPSGELLFTDHDHTYAGSGFDGGLTPTDPLAGLDHLARVVRESGITRITGDVLVDPRFFAAASSSGSGPRKVSPILVNDNMVDFVIEPGEKAGDPTTFRSVPGRPFLDVDNRVVTAEKDASSKIEANTFGDRRVQLRGQIPAGHQPILRSVAVEHPDDFARALFIQALRARGIDVIASPLDENTLANLPSTYEVARAPKVAEYLSPPFGQYIKVILKVSHNLHASTLPMLLAANNGRSSLEAGLKREGEILRSLGVEPGTASFGGGAGGNLADLVTPRATVTLLRAMRDRKAEFPVYEAALPILGRDGTSAQHVAPDSPARSHVRAKTGTYWVVNELDEKAVLTSKALAGYMETATGRSLTFAFFLNDVSLNADTSDASDAILAAGRLLGRLCEVVYDDEIPTNPKP